MFQCQEADSSWAGSHLRLLCDGSDLFEPDGRATVIGDLADQRAAVCQQAKPVSYAHISSFLLTQVMTCWCAFVLHRSGEPRTAWTCDFG